jgi:hypothetical protein
MLTYIHTDQIIHFCYQRTDRRRTQIRADHSPDAVARAAADALDPDVRRALDHGDAVVAGADLGVPDGDAAGLLDVDAVRVGAVPRRRHHRVHYGGMATPVLDWTVTWMPALFSDVRPRTSTFLDRYIVNDCAPTLRQC